VLSELAGQQVTSGTWVNDLFYFITLQGRLSYTINNKIFHVDSDRKSFIIGYVAA
jgi:coatomer subunit beta'